MGEITGAGLLAHVPTVVLPEATRRELNGGEDFTLVTGLRRLRREVFERDDYDTVVVLDSHWATTVEFVIAAQHRRSGLFTSDELPRGMRQMPYDYPGDPELAHNIAKFADRHGTWITPIDDPCLPVHYATLNLWTHLGRGLPGKRWVSVGVCQTGDQEDHLRLGRALADGIADTPGRRVLLIASGALSHTFWPLRELRDHEAGDPVHIFTQEARAADEQRIAWFREGRHDLVLDTMPEFRRFKPEARFGHYLMMAGALGEIACTAAGRQYGEYENSVGTGQALLWFDRPAGGWTAPRPAPRAVPRPAAPRPAGRHDPHHHVDPHLHVDPHAG
ncbi:3,4-dihydroxyphenylacetate 2,3-dioxygenase [Kitasatospora sp. NPDC056446]|uniref:3,4-dihydroxyphenylacetate 2,3-dioxygenase n=1 Tax=Kitasatospora sp. NPDC056446 TaxID=3345819 RepID=UPI0036BE299B